MIKKLNFPASHSYFYFKNIPRVFVEEFNIDERY